MSWTEGWGQWEDSPLDRLLSLRSSLAPPPSQCLLLPKLSCRADEGSSIFCTTPPHTHTSILWALGAPALLTAAASSSPALQDGCPSFQGKVPSVIPIADPRTLLLACRAGPSVNGLEEPSVAKRLRGTPERIELENYRLSVRQAEGLEEVPEETQAEHNLSSVLDTGTEEDAASRSVCGDCCLPGVGAMEP